MAINRDVEVRARIEILLTEVTDPDNPVGRGGARGKTEKRNITVPIMILDYDEIVSRSTDIGDAIQHGYELEGTTPPEAVTEGASAILTDGAILHGRILPNVNTFCGFLYGVTKELDNTQDADQSAIADASDVPIPITTTLVGLVANTRYYYRAWAEIANVRVRYGRMRSFKTLAV
jgi:hypothetical protein